ncbi:MAG: hypothetical protein ACFFCD_07845 [Promethearchaeota archaeon]
MSTKHYSVLIIDNFHMEPEYDYVIAGFPTLELAIEFARRWVRDSLENQRKSNQSKEELRKMWYAFGEDAVVLGGDYHGSSELDFFIDHPAKPEELDWQTIKKKTGIK